MTAPYRPRHRGPRASGGPDSPSCVLPVLLAAACLLGAACCLGGLLAHPFG